MQIVPLVDTPNQTVTIQLGGQACTLRLYTQTSGFYCDIYINQVLVLGGVLCANWTRIVRNLYLGFVGDLAFYDLQGTNPPSSPGLGTRYVLYYLTPTDLNGLDK